MDQISSWTTTGEAAVLRCDSSVTLSVDGMSVYYFLPLFHIPPAKHAARYYLMSVLAVWFDHHLLRNHRPHIAVKAFDTTSTFTQMLKACDVTRLPGLIADNHILGKHETYPTFASVISLRQNLDDLAPGRNVFLNPVPSYCLCPAFAMPRTRLITMLSTQIPGYSDGFWARVLEIVDIAHRNKSLLGNINVDDEVHPSERLHSTDDAINPAQLSLHPAAEGQNEHRERLPGALLYAQRNMYHSIPPLPGASHEVPDLDPSFHYEQISNGADCMLLGPCTDFDHQCLSSASSVDLGLQQLSDMWSSNTSLFISPERQSISNSSVCNSTFDDSALQIGDTNATDPSEIERSNGRDLAPTHPTSASGDMSISDRELSPVDHLQSANNTTQTPVTVIRRGKRKRNAPVATKDATPVGISNAKKENGIPLIVVRARFKEFEANVEDIPLVVGLLNYIGAPETICELRDACSMARKASCVTSDADITCSIKAIDELGKELVRIPMLRRYHVWKLMQHLNEEVEKLATADGRDSKAATTSILKALMGKTYPELSESSSTYAKTYKRLVQQTSHARHWYALQQEFSIGVLAVIPSPELIGFPLNKQALRSLHP